MLPVMVDSIMKDCSLEFSELSAVGISKGPGSYTGLRIGTSLAKGICFSQNIPLISLNAFKGMAANAAVKHPDCYYFSNLDARRNEIYLEIYNAELKVFREMLALVLSSETFNNYKENLVFCGNSNNKIAELCGFQSTPVYLDMEPDSEFLIAEAVEKWEKRDFEDTAYFEPFYLKEFLPGTTKKFSI